MKSLNYVTALMCIIIICLGIACSEKMSSLLVPPADKGIWYPLLSTDGSTPVKRHEAAFTGLKDKMYLFGGRGIKAVSIYDVVTNQWTEGSEPPIEMHHFQPVVYNDKMYVIGALTGKYPGETPIPHVYIYDPATDAWTQAHPIPTERQRGSTGNVVYNNKIYISCGIKDGHRGDHKNWLDEYDPVTGAWKILPDAPRARDHFQAAVAEDKIFIAGGRRSNAPDNTFNLTVGEVDVFDFKTLTWTTLANDLPTHRAGCMSISAGKEVLVIGGESGVQELAHNEVEALDIHQHTWKTYPSLIQGRHGTGLVLYDNSLFIASGCGNRGGNPELETVEKYTTRK